MEKPDYSDAAASLTEQFAEITARWQESGMAQTLGLAIKSIKRGEVVLTGRPEARFSNPQSILHGGFTATLIDSAMGCAVQTFLPLGTGYGTINLQVSYVRKVTTETGLLLCYASLLHTGKTMFTAEAMVKDENGKLYAHGTGNFLVYP